MDHGMMQGMFWAGVLLSSIPILLTFGVAGYVLHRHLKARAGRAPAPEALVDGGAP